MSEGHPDGAALAVEVRSKKFDPDTDRAKAAAMELADLLRLEFGDELPEADKAAGAKGDPVTVGAILLALITSGAVVKALECVKSWLERDPDERELRVSGTVGNRRIDLAVTARNVGDEHVTEMIRNLAGVQPGR